MCPRHRILHLCLTLGGALFFYPSFTQTGNAITLETCYAAALEHNPLGRQLALNQQATSLELERLQAARLPSVHLTGQAQYQSENVKVPFEVPGQDPIELPLFVAQVALEADYTIYDGGATLARQQLQEASLLADQQETVSALDQLKARINALFFAHLLNDTQIRILEASRQSLRERRQAVRTAVAQGAALPAGEDQLSVEILRLQARIDRLEGSSGALLAQLAHLTGLDLGPDTRLAPPATGPLPEPGRLEREELQTFELRQQQILAREALISARRRPRISAFGRAGMGYPNPLNFFDERFSPFALVGLRFSWNILDWKQSDRDRQALAVQSRHVAVQKELFAFDVGMKEKAILQDIRNLDGQLAADEEIVRLEADILDQLATQLAEGIATPADIIEQESRLARARLQREQHRLERLRAQVDFETEKGLR